MITQRVKYKGKQGRLVQYASQKYIIISLLFISLKHKSIFFSCFSTYSIDVLKYVLTYVLDDIYLTGFFTLIFENKL